ncbi:MAG: acyl-CoA dehydrogenase family protein [Pseudomonadota bacterium]
MTDPLLLESAERIFRDYADKALWDAAEQGTFARDLWQALVDNGFTAMALPDSGFALGDLYAVLKVAGQYAAPLPLAEALLAARWLGDAETMTSIGLALPEAPETASAVPWGRVAEQVLVLPQAEPFADPQRLADLSERSTLRVLSTDPAAAASGSNLAGEPRDQVSGTLAGSVEVAQPVLLLALARAVQMAGCLNQVLQLAIDYAGERAQFGRAIAKFQAVQHMLAAAAAEVAAAQRASDSAVAALGSERFGADLAAAKARVGEAAGVVAEIAHQVHGAMGFTHEHQLHHFTRRLWAWRDEYGNEAEWQRLLGAEVSALGADNAWGFIATPA